MTSSVWLCEFSVEKAFICEVKVFELSCVSSYVLSLIFDFRYDSFSNPVLDSSNGRIFVLFFLHVQSPLLRVQIGDVMWVWKLDCIQFQGYPAFEVCDLWYYRTWLQFGIKYVLRS